MSNKSIENAIAVERGKRIKFLRSYIAAMTGEKFAEYCGFARGTITNWETGKGKAGLTVKGAKQVVQAMQAIGIACTPGWLLHGIGDTPRITDQTKLSRLHYPTLETAQGGRVCDTSVRNTQDFMEEIVLFKKRCPAHLLCTLPDESMAPIYHTGDCVGGPRLLPNQFGLVKSSVCIIFLQSEKSFVRSVRLEDAQSEVMSFYVVNAEAALEHPPISRVPIESIVALAPVTRLWRNINYSQY